MSLRANHNLIGRAVSAYCLVRRRSVNLRVDKHLEGFRKIKVVFCDPEVESSYALFRGSALYKYMGSMGAKYLKIQDVGPSGCSPVLYNAIDPFLLTIYCQLLVSNMESSEPMRLPSVMF